MLRRIFIKNRILTEYKKYHNNESFDKDFWATSAAAKIYHTIKTMSEEQRNEMFSNKTKPIEYENIIMCDLRDIS